MIYSRSLPLLALSANQILHSIIVGPIQRRCFISSIRPFQSCLIQRTTRLFGSKRGTFGNPPGTISIFNEQAALPHLDLTRLEKTLHDIRHIIGYTTYDVTLVLNDDTQMRQLNRESRDIDAPTDILSFPFQDVIIEPGLLDEPDFDIPDYYNLGDLFVDVSYVIRRCQQDQEEYENHSNIEDNERGVSGAMAKIYNPEQRIHMLLIHGMLHLVGYDHIEDDEYELMVTKEEEILQKLDMIRTKKNI